MIDRATGDEQWATGVSSWTSSAIADGRVYVGSGSGVIAVDAAEAETWDLANETLNGDIVALIAVSDAFLVIGSSTFGVAVFKTPRDDSLTPTIEWKSPGGTEWSPAIANGSIYAVKWSKQSS